MMTTEIRCKWCGKKMGQVESPDGTEVSLSLVCANRRCGMPVALVIR